MGMVGKSGHVTIKVRGKLGPGQIQLHDGGTAIAWSTDVIEKGSEVVVTAERSIRTVTVSPTGL